MQNQVYTSVEIKTPVQFLQCFLNMSFLKTRVEQLQVCLKFLGSSDVVLKVTNMLMKVEKDRSSLKFFMQKISLKESM